MTLTARMEVVLEEVALDLRDYLRSLFGQPNDSLTRSMIQNEIWAYFEQHPDIENGFVQCDDANNAPDAVRQGKLTIAAHFTIDGVLFAGGAMIDPTRDTYADAYVQFFMQHIRPDAIATTNVKEMPPELASSLGL